MKEKTTQPVISNDTDSEDFDLRPFIDELVAKPESEFEVINEPKPTISKTKDDKITSISKIPMNKPIIEQGSIITVFKPTKGRNSGTSPIVPEVWASPGNLLKVAHLDIPKSSLSDADKKNLTSEKDEPTVILCDFIDSSSWPYGVYVDISNINTELPK